MHRKLQTMIQVKPPDHSCLLYMIFNPASRASSVPGCCQQCWGRQRWSPGRPERAWQSCWAHRWGRTSCGSSDAGPRRTCWWRRSSMSRYDGSRPFSLSHHHMWPPLYVHSMTVKTWAGNKMVHCLPTKTRPTSKSTISGYHGEVMASVSLSFLRSASRWARRSVQTQRAPSGLWGTYWRKWSTTCLCGAQRLNWPTTPWSCWWHWWKRGRGEDRGAIIVHQNKYCVIFKIYKVQIYLLNFLFIIMQQVTFLLVS